MSYHETYEFVALDRPLTTREMRALRAISTRAIITPTRFYNWYDWGGLNGNPRDMLRRYFDVFTWSGGYADHWGMLRFPAAQVKVATWQRYVPRQRGRESSRSISFSTSERHIILTLSPYIDEPLDEISGDEHWITSLVAIRAALMAGDLRPLYLAWLFTVQQGERRATDRAPSRPPGFAKLTGTLHAFADYLRLDPVLLKVALSAKMTKLHTVDQLWSAVGWN